MGQDEDVEVRPGLRRVTQGGGDRYYLWNRRQYPSVTTIIGAAIAKPHLLRWAAKEAALTALHNLDVLAPLLDEEIHFDPKDSRPTTPATARAAYDLMASAHERNRDKAADIGSRVHGIAEAHALGVEFPINPASDLAPFLTTLRRWFDEFQPDIIAAEAPVISERFGYAGTMDLMAVINGRRLLLDYKSGKSISSDVALQLSGLRYSDFMVMPDGSTLETPQMDGCAVVHIRPNGYRMFEVKADEDTFNTFRYAQAMYGWASSGSKAFKVQEIKAREVA